jgi:two-component system response regulator CpxR
MPVSKILMIDDDTQLATMLSEYLSAESFSLETIADGAEGLEAASAGDHDLIVLDVMLPGLSGFEILRQLRDRGSKKPVLMLTARGDDIDRIVGLEMGADDYLPKPFNPRELVARIKAVLRRSGEALNNAVPAELTVGPLKINTRRREAKLDDAPLKLTNAELIVLFTLAQSAGEVVSREVLTRTALGRQLLPDDRSLDTHVSNLRRKLAGGAIQIRSVRGAGYLLVPPETTT